MLSTFHVFSASSGKHCFFLKENAKITCTWRRRRNFFNVFVPQKLPVLHECEASWGRKTESKFHFIFKLPFPGTKQHHGSSLHFVDSWLMNPLQNFPQQQALAPISGCCVGYFGFLFHKPWNGFVPFHLGMRCLFKSTLTKFYVPCYLWHSKHLSKLFHCFE